MRDICPACGIDVEYDNKGYCSQCGRTKSVAEESVRFRNQQARDAKLKWLWISAGIVGLVAIFLLSPERSLGTLISTLVQVTGLVFFAWLFTKIRDALQRRKAK